MRLTERPGLLELSDRGLYCAAGDFYVDPWRQVERAVITHAHSDHARRGMGRYVCAAPGKALLRHRVGDDARIDGLEYGATKTVGSVKVSLHPAGHVLGSSQVRLEMDGEVAVVSGDYKGHRDPTCAAFEPIRCHTFVTESTFGLPIYRWPDPTTVFGAINDWWRVNQSAGRASLLMAYALGKSQRLLAGLDPSIGPIYLHGALVAMTDAYRAEGITLPPTKTISEAPKGEDWSRAMVLAPPSAENTPWTRRFGDRSTGYASGWMAIRGTRRRRALDRGFVLSDHVDWPALLETIRATEAGRVFVTHGYTSAVVRYLREQGVEAAELATRFEGESPDETSAEDEEP